MSIPPSVPQEQIVPGRTPPVSKGQLIRSCSARGMEGHKDLLGSLQAAAGAGHRRSEPGIPKTPGLGAVLARDRPAATPRVTIFYCGGSRCRRSLPRGTEPQGPLACGAGARPRLPSLHVAGKTRAHCSRLSLVHPAGMCCELLPKLCE